MRAPQAIGRPDLRLVVMSATLGGGLAEQVATLMADTECQSKETQVPCISSQGRSFPVKTMYLGVGVGP